MKKILLIFILCIFLVGCDKSGKDIIKSFEDKLSSNKYSLKGTMEIINGDDAFLYDIETIRDNSNYRVTLINKNNEHKQIILKNSNDVYVITPEINKSFKFQSEWPNNSSQSYILDSILIDINNDKDKKIIEDKDDKYIKCKVNYPNNDSLKYQKVHFDKNNNLKYVEVFDNNDIMQIKVVFDKIEYNKKIDKEEFNINNYIKEEKEEITEDDKINENQNTTSENDSVESNDEVSKVTDIIYPLYLPSDTYLSNSEKIDGERVILTFSGEKNFVLIEEAERVKETMEITPVYGDPLFMPNTIGALSGNSLSWSFDNMSYYLASSDLTTAEMLNIAVSMGNYKPVIGEK